MKQSNILKLSCFKELCDLAIDPYKYSYGQKRLHSAAQIFVRTSSQFVLFLTGQVFVRLSGQIFVRIGRYRVNADPIRTKTCPAPCKRGLNIFGSVL